MADQDEVNEIVAAAADAKAAAARTGRQWPLKAIGLGVGIGSAAVAAALLYTNRTRGDEAKRDRD